MTILSNLLRPFMERPAAVPAVRRFEAAAPRRWGEAPAFGRMATETALAVSAVRSRARNSYANDPHCHAAVEAWVTALVGSGARPTSAHSDTTVRAAIGAAFEDWAADADIVGRADWYGQQAEIARAMVLDGEAFVLLIDTPEGLRLRQIPAEQVDQNETRELKDGAHIASGVEFDRYGRRVAYWIRQEIPTSVLAAWAPPVRVDARDVLHVFRSMGPGQVRGLSWLAPVLFTATEVDKLQTALLLGAQVSSMHVGWIETTKTSEELVSSGLAYEPEPVEQLVPGTVKRLAVDEKLTTQTPPPQSQHGAAFLASQLRAIAVGVGVPAHLVSGDLSSANYSSLREDKIVFRQRAEQIQYAVIAHQLLRPVYERAITSMVFRGDIEAPDFESNAREWTRAEHLFPAWPWVDPGKEASARETMLNLGLTSRRQVAAELGWSIEALDAEIAADRAREVALGLSFGATAGAAPQPATEEPADNADA